jgi:hypothetical protein
VGTRSTAIAASNGIAAIGIAFKLEDGEEHACSHILYVRTVGKLLQTKYAMQMDTKRPTVKSKRGRHMPNTLNLIEQVRRRVPRETDYAVAKALEMQQSTLARVLAGKQGLGTKATVRVSEILQRDLKDVLVLIEEDKAKTAKEREFWERRSPRITAAILTTILALAAGFIGSTDPLSGLQTPGDSSRGYLTDLYIMRSYLLDFLNRLCLRYLGRWTKTLREILTCISARHPQSLLSLEMPDG